MGAVKSMIPLWVKEPAAIFLREAGKFPLELVGSHVRRSFVTNQKSDPNTIARANQAVQRATYAYLSKRYQPLAMELINQYSLGTKPENPAIWVFWWQGEEYAPEIVKRCIASIRANSGGIPVHVIDAQNYEDYVHVPDHILEKLNRKIISITHFSDYYRMALLAAHGGLWIDASLFMASPLNADIFDKPVFTVRNPGLDISNISYWEWTVGVIGGWKDNVLFHAARELLDAYWQDHDQAADYFIFDYMIRLIYNHCAAVREALAEVKANNSKLYFLQQHASHPFDDRIYHRKPDSDTWLYRLSWKGTYPLQTPDGQETLYARWLKETGGI